MTITQITPMVNAETTTDDYIEVIKWFNKHQHERYDNPDLLKKSNLNLLIFAGDKTPFDFYLEQFKNPIEKQATNCHTCRNFINGYGSLVNVTENGTIELFGLIDTDKDGFDNISDTVEKTAYKALCDYIRNGKQWEVFTLETFDKTSDKYYGVAKTGTWYHFALNNLQRKVFKEAIESNIPSTNSSGHGYGKDEVVALNNFIDEIEHVDKNALLARDTLRLREISVWDELREWVNVIATNRQMLVRRELIQNGLTKLMIRSGPLGTYINWLAKGDDPVIARNKYYGLCDPTKYKRKTRPPQGKEFEASVAYLEENGIDALMPQEFLSPEDLKLYPSFTNIWLREDPITDKDPVGKTSIFNKQSIVLNKLHGTDEHTFVRELPPMKVSLIHLAKNILPKLDIIDVYTDKLINTQSYFAGGITHNRSENAGRIYKDGSPVRKFFLSKPIDPNGFNKSSDPLVAGVIKVHAIHTSDIPLDEYSVGVHMSLLVTGIDFKISLPTPLFADTLINELQPHTRTIDHWCNLNYINRNDEGKLMPTTDAITTIAISVGNSVIIKYKDTDGVIVSREFIIGSQT